MHPLWIAVLGSALAFRFGDKKAFHATMDGVRNAVADLRNDALNKYGSDTGVLWDTSLLVKGEDALVARFVRTMAFRDAFVYAFTGTSVTEGAENRPEEKYSVVFEKLFRRVTDAADLRLDVRNVAMGKNPASPYDYCVVQNAGYDADIVSWEQSMMTRSDVMVEVFMRSALLTKNCPLTNLLMLVSSDLGGKSHRGKQRQRRYYNSLAHHYSGLGLHSIMANFSDYPVGNPNFEAYHLQQEGKPNGDGGSWHPSPYGHEFMAYVLSTSYARLWTKAADQLETLVAMSGSFETNVRHYLDEHEVEHKTVPQPRKSCNAMCPVDRPAQCFSALLPRHESSADLINVVSSDNVLDTRTTGRDTVGFTPKKNADMFENQWVYQRHPHRASGHNHSLSEPLEYGRFCIAGSPDSGTLNLVANLAHESPILVCEPYMHHRYGFNSMQSAGTVHFTVDDNAVETKSSKLCSFLGVFPRGRHTVQIEALEAGSYICPSHLIYT